MNRIASAICVLTSLAAVPVMAVPIASDSFANEAGGADYAVGSIGGQNPTVGLSGFTGAWSSGTAAMVSATGGLTHDLTPGTPLAGEVVAFTSAGSASRRLVRALNYTPTDGTYFMSVLLQKDAATTTRDIFAGLGPSEGATSSFGSSQATYIGIFNGGISFTPGGAVFTQLMTPAQVLVGETYYALMEFDYSSTGADSVTASIFDSQSQLVANETFAGLDLDGDISHLSIATSDFDPTVILDEFRFGTEVQDVMVVPEPATLSLLAMGGLALLSRRRAV